MLQQEEASKEWKEFEELNAKLRENIKLMSSQKDNLSSKHKSDRQKAKAEVDRLYNETCKIFSYLSALRHKSLGRCEQSQHTLSNLCKTLDIESLDVKNFEYEQCDTLKHIAICDDYKSHSNEPILISKQEFYKYNPQPEMNDIHEEKTKRLQFELQQRKQLQNNLREITANVATLSNELSEKNKFLNNLKSKIGNVFNAILPLQKYMNLPSTMLYPNENEINLLPQQLFAIYQSFTTQIYCNNISEQEIKMNIINRINNNNNDLKIDCENNKNDSETNILISSTCASVLGKRKYKDIQKNKEHKKEECDGLEDGELSQEPPRKRVRTSSKSSKDKKQSRDRDRDRDRDKNRDRDRDRDKNSKRSRRHSNSNSSNKDRDSKLSKNSEKKSVHMKIDSVNNIKKCMSVEMNNLIGNMQLNVEFKRIGIQLQFMYCEMYNLILVCVKNITNGKWDNPNVYMELFDGHKMIELPDILGKELRYIDNGDMVPYFSAYSWAQELGGNYIFNDMKCKGKRDIINLIVLEKVLELRKENRLSLQTQIKKLMDCNGNGLYLQTVMNKVDNKNKVMMVMNKIVMFKLLSDKVICKNKYSIYFKLVLERVPFKLECVIQIKPGYPDKEPLFYVNDIWNSKNKKRDGNYFVNECKNIEIKLNGGCKEYVLDENMDLLVSVMIYKLQMYFDVYVQSQIMQDNNNLICNQLSGSPIRMHRGRDRRQQY